MSKRAREEDKWEEAKEPWFFWGLEQQRWIDAFVAHMREHPVTDPSTFQLGVTVWPDVTISPTIAPSWKFSAYKSPENSSGVLFTVTMSTSLWDQLRSGFLVFSREIVIRVIESLPEYHYIEAWEPRRYEELTKLDYGKCIVKLKRVSPDGEKK